MSINYKLKKKKKTLSDSKVTLIAKHSQKINELTQIENSLPKLEKEVKNLENEKKKILNSNDGFGFIETENGKQIYFINKKITELKKTISKIKDGSIKNDYFSKTADILYKYYEDIKDVSQRHENNNEEPKSIIDLLKKSSKNEKKDKLNRAILLDKYNKIIEPEKYKTSNVLNPFNVYMCEQCDIEMNLIQSEGMLLCQNCGKEEQLLIDSDKPSYKDPPPEIGEFTYKRIHRLDEWLTQHQAKETTEIPQEVIDSILLELKKEGITNLYYLTMEKVRSYLKKLGLNKYYEHIPHIIYCLNGLPTPKLLPETEEKLRAMFRQIQDIFDQVCPDDRTNFLSYSYLLRKLFELLGEDEHKEYFRLHKSRDKIYQHDKVWQKICKILGWQYIRTV